MSLFLETIKINNGRRINLDGHSRRMNRTRNQHFHEIRDIDLERIVIVPPNYKSGIVKCRVSYGRKIEKITFENYHFKNPRTFHLLDADHIVYQYKAADRSALKDLYDSRGEADDIIMVRNGLLTDSYYANIVFLKGGIWYTPAQPMLNGTFREKLIMNEKLVQEDITAEELSTFEQIKIINALTEWEMHEPVKILINKTIFR